MDKHPSYLTFSPGERVRVGSTYGHVALATYGKIYVHLVSGLAALEPRFVEKLGGCEGRMGGPTSTPRRPAPYLTLLAA